MTFKLYDYQESALLKMKIGCVLCGGVGSGKTLTSLSFYKRQYDSMKLVVITTAMKRNTGDWVREAAMVGIDEVIVDSWNNVAKFVDYKDHFFIFDEQRAVSFGTWSKSLIKIAKKNKWILLSATPGDVWMDYCPIFIANGFFKNKTEFINRHVEYNQFTNYPSVKRYHREEELLVLQKKIMVIMKDQRVAKRQVKHIDCKYDEYEMKRIMKDRWDIFNDEPIRDAAGMTRCARTLVAISDHRQFKMLQLMTENDKVIVFYNYNYELDILRDLCSQSGREWGEYNGTQHDPIPQTEKWVYLVQYIAGAEGWNCIDTNVTIFYSPNYSYKIMEQAMGRIDRINTSYSTLYYYILTSQSDIDQAVLRTLKNKKKFNETKYIKKLGIEFREPELDPFAEKYNILY